MTTTKSRFEFRPNWYSPTGDTVKSCMRAHNNMSPATLAELTGRDLKWTLRFLSGEVRIDEEYAAQLVRVFGSTANFWMTRDAQYWADKELIDGASEKIPQVIADINKIINEANKQSRISVVAIVVSRDKIRVGLGNSWEDGGKDFFYLLHIDDNISSTKLFNAIVKSFPKASVLYE